MKASVISTWGRKTKVAAMCSSVSSDWEEQELSMAPGPPEIVPASLSLACLQVPPVEG